MDEHAHPRTLQRVGLVPHPSRRLDDVVDLIGDWANGHGVAIGQVPVPGRGQTLADPVAAADCDLLVALGGDGTTLVALHAGAAASRPVLGVACGSIGALTMVTAERLGWALDEVSAHRWTPTGVPALDIAWGERTSEAAINDLVVVRDGPGQVLVSISVDGVLYAQLAGDGVVVATALGSSAYNMAAGGPLLAPGAEGIAVTPLAVHGGASAPLVVGTGSRLTLAVHPGYGGVRFEVDGRRTVEDGQLLDIRLQAGYATRVSLAEEEARLSGLRRRGLIRDSPRVGIREARGPHATA
jgi:NAD+ kinase